MRTATEQAQFLDDAPVFERMLTESGVILVKYWLDISKAEQAGRLDKRRSDPLKRLKVSRSTRWRRIGGTTIRRRATRC